MITTDSFVFYRSFAEAMEDLPAEDFKDVSMALIGYALDGVEPELPKRLRPYFVLMRQNVETSQKRRAAGKTGGRPKTNGYENVKPMVSENENHRLQDSKTNGYENKKPMVIENENHRLSNSETNGFENQKPMVSQPEPTPAEDPSLARARTRINNNNNIYNTPSLNSNSITENNTKGLDKEGVKDREYEGKGTQTTRHRYGTYGNVLLSDQDLEKLKKEFPFDWQERIDRVDAYVQMHGKPYKDYLATIRAWARKDQERAPESKARTGPLNNFSEAGYQNDDYARILEENRRRLEERVANIGK